MELINIAQQIENKIKLLEKGRGILQQLAEQKAAMAAEYDKQVAFTIIRLKNGEEMELSGQKIINPPASYTEKIARGICWQAKLGMDKAEAEYKIGIEKIRCVEAELNGYQSVFRHLDEK